MMIFAMAALLASGAVGTVQTPVANMHSAPTEDADVVSQAIYSTPVDVLDEKPGWLRIRTPDDYTGWTRDGAVRRAERDAARYALGRAVVVHSLFAHLYREPSVTRHQPLLTVPFESRLEVAAEPETDSRRWLQVRLVDGQLAWVQRGDIADSAAPLNTTETIALARRFLGLPYTWGGTSSYGYDCSGFTQMLCRRQGKSIPRDAGPQARWDGMSPVERGNLEPGDLLYFGGSLEKVNHTGMYIGGGQFIHATANTTPVIQISRLDDQPWTRLFVAARRVK